MSDPAPVGDPRDGTEPAQPPLAWDAIRVATVATLGILTLVVAVLVVYLLSYASGQRLTQQCLQAQVDELNSSVIAGRDAGRQDRQAQRELLLAQGDRVAALQRYLAQLDEADKTRSGSPPPTRRCT